MRFACGDGSAVSHPPHSFSVSVWHVQSQLSTQAGQHFLPLKGPARFDVAPSIHVRVPIRPMLRSTWFGIDVLSWSVPRVLRFAWKQPIQAIPSNGATKVVSVRRDRPPLPLSLFAWLTRLAQTDGPCPSRREKTHHAATCPPATAADPTQSRRSIIFPIPRSGHDTRMLHRMGWA